MEDAEIWVRFAAAAVARDNAITAKDAASIADALTNEFKTRFRENPHAEYDKVRYERISKD